jgi:hypothetical protein
MNSLLSKIESSLKGWRKMHHRVGAHPFTWVFTADKLLRGFIVLAEQTRADIPSKRDELLHAPDLVAVTMLLGALTIENLIKAICVERCASPFDARGKFALKSHNLVKLADRAGIVLNSDEAALLERLRTYIDWRGRYPIPLRGEDMGVDPHPFGEGYRLGSPDFEAILDLAKKLRGLVPDSDVPYACFSFDI